MHKFVLDLQGTVITKSFVVIIIYEVFALYYFLGIDFFFKKDVKRKAVRQFILVFVSLSRICLIRKDL